MGIMAIVGLVLVVACTNLANLVLARGSARTHELAVRRALGASRSRLVTEQLAETSLLAGMGRSARFSSRGCCSSVSPPSICPSPSPPSCRYSRSSTRRR
jgi:predicted lysophospholipase L1 biosynthesis ABC-type transport system permease subunit